MKNPCVTPVDGLRDLMLGALLVLFGVLLLVLFITGVLGFITDEIGGFMFIGVLIDFLLLALGLIAIGMGWV